MNQYDIEQTATRIAEFSRQALDGGQPEKADALLQIAANLELTSPELQNCWGGPLNGQHGRQAIFHQLIDKLDLDVILETGTFRGLTTAWFADNFLKSIYSCEADKRYYYQAKHNLTNRKEVHLSLEDSREFLRKRVAALSSDTRYFAYLDAHWQNDLPLAEEIRIISQGSADWVVAIDDFKVPGDDYKFDDYGPGKALSLDLLEEYRDESITFYFPKISAKEETGAVRGVCIMAKGLVPELNQCDLLIGDSWENWKRVELAYDATHPVVASEYGANDPTPDTPILDVQRPLEIDALNTRLSAILESQSAMRAVIEKQLRSIDEKLDPVGDERDNGRTLVEQKARNLDLERQVYRLTEEVRELSLKSINAQSYQATIVSLNEIKNLVANLSRSRAINLVSKVAPAARHTVAQISDRLNRIAP